MTLVPRLPRILLASAFALTALGTAPAFAEPAAPAPVPVPYPNTSSPNTSPRDPASGLPTGQRMHKPFTLTTSAAPAPCPAPNVAPVTVASSDPQEGGEVARTAAKPNVAPVTVASSDPEEGGEIARATGQKVKVSDIKVVKVMDKASPTLAESAPSGTGAACNSGQH